MNNDISRLAAELERITARNHANHKAESMAHIEEEEARDRLNAARNKAIHAEFGIPYIAPTEEHIRRLRQERLMHCGLGGCGAK
jgi:hypothetical protein